MINNILKLSDLERVISQSQAVHLQLAVGYLGSPTLGGEKERELSHTSVPLTHPTQKALK